ncbi:MAG: hypothetical protein AB7O67_13815 [Vicinamibacterales bacterium]
MRPLVAGVVVLAALVAAIPALAQAPPQPLSGFVIDAHGVSGGLPDGPGWVADVPEGTLLPARSLGLDGSAHVYLAHLGPVTLGAGARLVFVRGTTTAPVVDDTDGAAANTVPDVTTRFRAFAPEVSFNFGHRRGWSYISGGVGRARVENEATLGATTVTAGPDGWVSIFNYGGGARWMITRHIGFSFDLRWHQLSGLDATETFPGAMRSKLFVAGAGISIH